MTITKVTKKAGFLRSKIALVSAVSLGLAAIPAALAVPAQASSSYGACTITPIAPKKMYYPGQVLVDYQVKVYCPQGDQTVWVYQDRWERDAWPDSNDYLGNSYLSQYFHNGGTIVFHNFQPLKQTDFGYGDKYEEVYQRVSFRVERNGQWSGPSNWVTSGLTNILR